MRDLGKIGFGILVSLIVATGSASAACSNSNLNGPFGFSLRAVSSPVINVGTFTADGAGNISSGQLTQSINGVISSVTFSGTYAVKNDCTGTITTTDSVSNARDFFVVLSGPNKNAVTLLENDPGLTASGVARAQGVGVCSLTGGKTQAFSARLDGLVGSAPETIVGKFATNGSGAVAVGTAVLDLGGTYHKPSPVTGTYTSNSNCSGTMQITFGGTTYNFNYTAVDAVRQLILIETDSNTTTGGTLSVE